MILKNALLTLPGVMQPGNAATLSHPKKTYSMLASGVNYIALLQPTSNF